MTDAQGSRTSRTDDLSGFFHRLSAVVEGATESHKAALMGFFAGLEPAVAVARRAQVELDRAFAPAFSPFLYFKTEELDLSRIFGDLLDPRGSHGQGVAFLRALLDGFPQIADLRPRLDLPGCRVHLEFITRTLDADRRIDIVLEMPGGTWIGIENKPWAADQENQIRDYLRDLRGRGGKPPWVLYLSGDGTLPAEYHELEGEEGGHCLTVAYRDAGGEQPSVEAWIERCIDECRAERVRWFLHELLRFIQRTFSGSVSEPSRSTP